MRIIFNQDKILVKIITEAIEKNSGFCPCRLEKTEDTRCMCKEFRDRSTPGPCHCGLYEKVDD